MRQAAVLLLFASLLSPQATYALDLNRFTQIEDNNLAQIFDGLYTVAAFTGYFDHNPFIVKVRTARGQYRTPQKECGSFWQDAVIIVASSFDEAPAVAAFSLPLACDWQFSRWLDFPPASEGEAPITMEFIKRLPGKGEKLVWVKINPYRAELFEKSEKGTTTYPPNQGYSRLGRLQQDNVAEVVGELSSLREDTSTPHLFKADVKKVRLVNNGTGQRCSGDQEIISISVAEKNTAHDATSFYVDCQGGENWAFDKWTLTGKKSIEAGYLGFTLVDRKSKIIRHILCNPWTAYFKDVVE